MRRSVIAILAGAAAALGGGAQAASIVVDGGLDATYGGSRAHVAASALTSPLWTEGAAGYDLYLASDAANVYAFFAADADAAPFDAAQAAPASPAFGSGLDPVFGFGPGGPSTIATIRGATPMSGVTAVRDAAGDLELSIPISDFTSAFAAISYASAQRLKRPASFALGASPSIGASGPAERLVAAPSATSPAPEPATWLTLILGVGLAGVALRREAGRGLESSALRG